MSGARLDRGETELALGELEIPELDPDRAFEWSPALFSARAAVLEDLGRADEAAFWAERADVAASALGLDGQFDEMIVEDGFDEDYEDEDEDAFDSQDEAGSDDEAASDDESEDESEDEVGPEDDEPVLAEDEADEARDDVQDDVQAEETDD
jgi:hypothetical protein